MAILTSVTEFLNDRLGLSSPLSRPLNEAEQLLKAWDIPFKAMSDGSTFVPGDLKRIGNTLVDKRGETKLSVDLSKVYVGGNCLFEAFGLTTLEGSPPFVGGDYRISGNPKLKNLSDGPAFVGGEYNVNANTALKTLEDRAYKIGGSLAAETTAFNAQGNIDTSRGYGLTGHKYNDPSALPRSAEAESNARKAYEACQNTEAYRMAIKQLEMKAAAEAQRKADEKRAALYDQGKADFWQHYKAVKKSMRILRGEGSETSPNEISPAGAFLFTVIATPALIVGGFAAISAFGPIVGGTLALVGAMTSVSAFASKNQIFDNFSALLGASIVTPYRMVKNMFKSGEGSQSEANPQAASTPDLSHKVELGSSKSAFNDAAGVKAKEAQPSVDNNIRNNYKMRSPS